MGIIDTSNLESASSEVLNRDDRIELYLAFLENRFNEENGGVSCIDFINLDTDDIVEEAKLGEVNLKKVAKLCVVEFRTNEGWEKPHFHIFSLFHKFQCAVRLDIPDYFIHNPYTDTLTNEQSKILDAFLRRSNKHQDMTRWEEAKALYDAQFGKTHPLSTNTQPDYSELS